MVLWWTGVAAGVLLLVVSGGLALATVYRDRRVPRFGVVPFAVPDGSPRRVWFVWSAGIVLIGLCAGGLSEEGGYWARAGGAALIAWVGQSLLVWRHNRRAAATARRC